MDKEIPLPVRDIDKPFLLSVDGSINISGRGTVVTGTVEQGQAKIGDEVALIGIKRRALASTITGIETFN